MNWNNEYRIVGGTHEPVGTAGETIFWPDKELLCPECKKWSKDYGNFSVSNEDGTESYICEDCGRTAWQD